MAESLQFNPNAPRLDIHIRNKVDFLPFNLSNKGDVKKLIESEFTPTERQALNAAIARDNYSDWQRIWTERTGHTIITHGLGNGALTRVIANMPAENDLYADRYDPRNFNEYIYYREHRDPNMREKYFIPAYPDLLAHKGGESDTFSIISPRNIIVTDPVETAAINSAVDQRTRFAKDQLSNLPRPDGYIIEWYDKQENSIGYISPIPTREIRVLGIIEYTASDLKAKAKIMRTVQRLPLLLRPETAAQVGERLTSSAQSKKTIFMNQLFYFHPELQQSSYEDTLDYHFGLTNTFHFVFLRLREIEQGGVNLNLDWDEINRQGFDHVNLTFASTDFPPPSLPSLQRH